MNWLSNNWIWIVAFGSPALMMFRRRGHRHHEGGYGSREGYSRSEHAQATPRGSEGGGHRHGCC